MFKLRLGALMLPIAALWISCGSDGGDGATPSPFPSPDATATPVNVEVPEKPSTLAQYPASVAAYASASPDEAAACLPELLAAWAMPSIDLEQACTSANTDADPQSELVVVASGVEAGVTSYVVFVLDEAGDAYNVEFESTIYPVPANAAPAWTPLLAAGDLNADAIGEFSYTSQLCAEAGCFNSAYIIQGSNSGYEALPPVDGIGVIEGTFAFSDTDGDGSQELLASGTALAAPPAGPQRQIVQTWGWDGTGYVLRDSAPGASNYFYHRVLDADALLAAGDYGGAEAAYMAAVDDPSLLLWKPDDNERNELDAYGLFRAALAGLLAGGDAAAANANLDRARAIPNTLHAQLAASFQAAYAAKGEVGVGCTAANEDVRFNEAEYAAFWDYGTDNPPFDPANVCPF